MVQLLKHLAFNLLQLHSVFSVVCAIRSRIFTWKYHTAGVLQHFYIKDFTPARKLARNFSETGVQPLVLKLKVNSRESI